MPRKTKRAAMSLLAFIRYCFVRVADKLEAAHEGEETMGQAVLAFIAMMAGICCLFVALAIACVPT